jgi:hypothetical protein
MEPNIKYCSVCGGAIDINSDANTPDYKYDGKTDTVVHTNPEQCNSN